MDFKNWLLQTKIDKPELDSFITKLESLFTDTGFNSSDFEKKIDTGLKKIDTDITEILKPESNVKN